jgi:hypothetical protein
MNQQEYLAELKRRLRFRGASRRRANEVVAEVRSHLADSGEDPLDTFGTPEEYAASVLRGYRWPTARLLTLMVLAVSGASLAYIGGSGLRDGESTVVVGITDLATWLVLALVSPLGLLPPINRRYPSIVTRMAVVVPVGGLAMCAAMYVASEVLGDRTLFGVRSVVMFPVGLGLLAVAGLLGVVSALRHR